ncbi:MULTISPECIES: hypothetical protein [unclassified Serratia (in: enterobacteria)]|uniref:hypothetical protein n=1 Tax=unclassified Serratia (in: enterobacteria) TaxID=2647522 RepID=UPI000503C631|nr:MULTISPECIES: hypothetical protein [unclassified Serratia (in: enterobacteria)]KFK92006.1 bacteriophage protein [Serratia sp. Ag2]KFK98407.1 bacteriophage protein [Serratia sp. Ag1]
MSKNWMRHFELQLLDKDGTGIDLSNFKVTFEIEKMPATVFNGFVGNFKVYNLSPDTENKIMGKEFAKIRAIAGYDGMPDSNGNYTDSNFGLIFNGDIRFTITGKDSITDNWILIQCIDSWEGHLNASVKTTVAAGWKYADLFDQGMKTYAPFGITSGAAPTMPTTVFPRGRVIYKTTSALMYDIAKQCDGNWWFENNQVHILPESKYLTEAFVLNANTGLIGRPQQTMGNGVNARCLINPNIKLGSLVRIDQTSVYRASLSGSAVATAEGRLREQEQDGNLSVSVPSMPPASINVDGDYIVYSIDYHGDTRGQSWYMDLMCIARGSKDLLTKSALDKGISDG